MQDMSNNTDLPQVQPIHSSGSTPMPPAIRQPGVALQLSVPDEAADADLIEKEWVHKAKQIVDQTADDPYLQQAQLSRIKADYMKKRYNKDIKVPEE
jgi:hypothetical protein